MPAMAVCRRFHQPSSEKKPPVRVPGCGARALAGRFRGCESVIVKGGHSTFFGRKRGTFYFFCPSLVAAAGMDANPQTTRFSTTIAMSFVLPVELADPDVRLGIERAAQGERKSGTPFISFFTPTEMLTLVREAGFREVQHVSAATLAQRYFAGRSDGRRPPNNSEELLVANT
jgi:hypothetical protein